jgi:hypothetical protein
MTKRHLDNYSREQFPLFADAVTEAYARRLAEQPTHVTGRRPVAAVVLVFSVGLIVGLAAGILITEWLVTR